MFVVPMLIPPFSDKRRFFPRKWQTFHFDWSFTYRRQYATMFPNNDVIAFVSFFGVDCIYCANAEGVSELAMNPTRYPKDLKLYGTEGFCA